VALVLSLSNEVGFPYGKRYHLEALKREIEIEFRGHRGWPIHVCVVALRKEELSGRLQLL
jgi:hypothetical protein